MLPFRPWLCVYGIRRFALNSFCVQRTISRCMCMMCGSFRWSPVQNGVGDVVGIFCEQPKGLLRLAIVRIHYAQCSRLNVFLASDVGNATENSGSFVFGCICRQCVSIVRAPTCVWWPSSATNMLNPHTNSLFDGGSRGTRACEMRLEFKTSYDNVGGIIIPIIKSCDFLKKKSYEFANYPNYYIIYTCSHV